MTISILLPNDWRVQEDDRADGVASEADDVQHREVRQQALCGPALVVEDRLWIERDAPGEEVEPAEDLRDGLGERSEFIVGRVGKKQPRHEEA